MPDADLVRYVNVEKGYGFKYWELGNELDLERKAGRTDIPVGPAYVSPGLIDVTALPERHAGAINVHVSAVESAGHDIVFLQAGVTQAGFFANVDRTRRQGLELAAQGRGPRLDWQASYTWLDATYRSGQVLPGPLSTGDQPNTVRRGSPIAGLPRHVLKLSADWRFLPRWSVGADLLAMGSQAVAGNEGGNHPELGRLGGYTVVHARLRWQFRDGWHATLRVHNLFDRRYATYAAGNLDFFPGGVALRPGMEPAAARFIAPGAPRLAVVGVTYEWN